MKILPTWNGLIIKGVTVNCIVVISLQLLNQECKKTLILLMCAGCKGSKHRGRKYEWKCIQTKWY